VFPSVSDVDGVPFVLASSSEMVDDPKSEPKPFGGSVVGEEDDEAVGGIKTPVTLPRFDPLSVSSASAGSKEDVRLKVRLARLQLEAHEKAQIRQYQLEIKKLEIEAEKAVRLRKLELEAQSRATVGTAPVFSAGLAGPIASVPSQDRFFDITKYVALVPSFRETEVDCYFTAFERIAQALQWPKDVWSLLLQCKIHGKAQEVVAVLPLEDSLDYEKVKEAFFKSL